MRLHEWTDKAGFLRRSMIKDTDPDEAAPRGLPIGPPDLQQLDWLAIVRNIHNDLMAEGLYTWQDIANSQNGLSKILTRRVKRPIIEFFRNGGISND